MTPLSDPMTPQQLQAAHIPLLQSTRGRNSSHNHTARQSGHIHKYSRRQYIPEDTTRIMLVWLCYPPSLHWSEGNITKDLIAQA